MKIDKKYIMLITEEDERNEHQLDFYADRPWEGLLRDIIYGNNISELCSSGENEGLFYQLYESKSGKRIGYGIFDLDSLVDDIKFWEKSEEELDTILKTMWKYNVDSYASGIVIANTKEEAEHKVFKKYNEVDFNDGVPKIRLWSVLVDDSFDEEYPNIIEFE